MSRDPYRSAPSATLAENDQAKARAIGENVRERARLSEREPDPVAIEHERFLGRLDRIGRDAPALRTAWVALDQHLVHPIPLGPDLLPSAEPLTDVESILQHWTDRPSDRVGFATGKHPVRPWTYLAVAVDLFGTWKEWLRKTAAVTETVRDLGGFADLGDTPEVGRPKQVKRYRDHGGGLTVLRWEPPPLPSMKLWKMDAAGGELNRAMEKTKPGRGGWIWMAVNGDVTVKRDRQVDDGIRLLADGTVIPWVGSRTADGWTITLQSAASTADGMRPTKSLPEFSPWFLKALTGKKQR